MSSQQRASYEPQTPHRPLMVAAGVCGFILFTAIMMGALYLFYLPAADEHPFRITQFSPPRLQIDPSKDLERVDRTQHARLHRSGWLDDKKTRLAIPIDSAMKLVAGRGEHVFAPLPNAPQEPPGSRPAGASAPAGRRSNPGAGQTDPMREEK